MKGLVCESIDGERLSRLFTQTVLKNDEFCAAVALKVGEACHDLEIHPRGDVGCLPVPEVVVQPQVGRRPVRGRPNLSIAGAGADENLRVEMPSEDPEVAAHVEWPAIPGDQLVDSIAVEVGKFVIAGGEQLGDGLAIRCENVGGAPIRASLNVDEYARSIPRVRWFEKADSHTGAAIQREVVN